MKQSKLDQKEAYSSTRKKEPEKKSKKQYSEKAVELAENMKNRGIAG